MSSTADLGGGPVVFMWCVQMLAGMTVGQLKKEIEERTTVSEQRMGHSPEPSMACTVSKCTPGLLHAPKGALAFFNFRFLQIPKSFS